MTMSNDTHIVKDSIGKIIHYGKLKYTLCLYGVYVMVKLVERSPPQRDSKEKRKVKKWI